MCFYFKFNVKFFNFILSQNISYIMMLLVLLLTFTTASYVKLVSYFIKIINIHFWGAYVQSFGTKDLNFFYQSINQIQFC